MVNSYIFQTNQQHEPVDLDRVFNEIEAIAVFSDEGKWDDDLEKLEEEDRIFAYNQPSEDFIAVGNVDEPWDESAITDSENKVAPESDSDEFQVGVDWENWFEPGGGYSLSDVRQVLGYEKKFGVPDAICHIEGPSEDTIEGLYTTIAEGDKLEVSTEEQNTVGPDANRYAPRESGDSDGRHTSRDQNLGQAQRLFVQRGSDAPYRQHLGDSLTTPLSVDIRAELQYLIEESDVNNKYTSQLYDLLEEENVTAWGASQEHDIVRSMSSGDVVLYLDSKSQNRDIRYQQQVELALPKPLEDPDRLDLHKKIADLIWRSDNFTSLWFSKKDIKYYSNNSNDDGYQAFNSLNNPVNQSFTYYGDWFTKNVSGGSLVEVGSEYLRHYDGVKGYIQKLQNTKYVDMIAPPTPKFLIVDYDELRERDFPPVVHEFDGYDAAPEEQSTDPRRKYVGKFEDEHPDEAELIKNTDVHGYVLIRDEDKIVASAKMGCWFRKKVKGSYYSIELTGSQYGIVTLVDYREFDEDVIMDHELLEFADNSGLDPWTSGVAEINPDTQDARLTYQTARALSVSPGYHRRIPRFIEQESQQTEVYSSAVVHLISGRNVIFYGPPGTGKTRAATRLLQGGLGIGYDLSTAHAELTNYDIVGGYAPGSSKEQGDGETTINWQQNPGIVTAAVESCSTELERGDHHWLVFDELNRTNLDQAFGDIFTLLDLDYRTEQTLEYADEETSVPLSFRILGTLNTEDQAKLFSLGGAFRRRFGFVPVASLLSTNRVETSTDQRAPDTDISVPETATEIREGIVETATIEDLARTRVLVDEPAPVVHPRDVAVLDPVFASSARIKSAFNTVTSDTSLGYTTDIDGLDVILELAACLETNDIVTVGHTHLIDIAKFLTAAEMITDKGVSRRWLDEAVIAYILPQMDSFFTQVREEQAIGNLPGEDEKSLGSKLEDFLELLDEYGLSKSRSLIQTRDRGTGIV